MKLYMLGEHGYTAGGTGLIWRQSQGVDQGGPRSIRMMLRVVF